MPLETVVVPDLGGVDSVEVIELSCVPGQQLKSEDALVVLESDKASMDVPSPVSGILQRYLVSEGDSVAVGDSIAEIITEAPLEVHEELASEPEAELALISTDAGQSSLIHPTSPDLTMAGVSSTDPMETDRVLRVPDTGSDTSLEVIEVVVAVGDEIVEGETLLILESDKATIDVPAAESGVISAVLVALADKVNSGDPLVRVASIHGAGSQSFSSDSLIRAKNSSANKLGKVAKLDGVDLAKGPVSSAEQAVTALPLVRDRFGSTEAKEVYAGPAVRLFARELGVDLTQVTGSGARKRISRDDLNAFVKRRLGENVVGHQPLHTGLLQAEDFAKFGSVESFEMSKIQKLTADNLHASWSAVPHVTQFDEADITELEGFRKSLVDEAKKRSLKLTLLAFIVKAVAMTLRANPVFNRSLIDDGASYVQKDYFHIGIAVNTPRGLLVPVIRDVDKKGLWDLTGEISELAGNAKQGKLKVADMQGGCLTISSLGALGGQGFTPIVNTPEVGILGVSNAQTKPLWDGTVFQPRLLIPLSLSYDHRLINGVDGGRFMLQLVKILTDIRHLTLA